jgi:hypothetical protein
MSRRALALIAVAGLVAGGTALAQSGSDPYDLPEPAVRDGQVLQLAGAASCLDDRHLRVRFTPPAGAVFGWFEITVDGRRAARLTGVPRAASATVLVPRGRSLVRVRGETLGGQRVAADRRYRTCSDAPPPSPERPIQQGGGED